MWVWREEGWAVRAPKVKWKSWHLTVRGAPAQARYKQGWVDEVVF